MILSENRCTLFRIMLYSGSSHEPEIRGRRSHHPSRHRAGDLVRPGTGHAAGIDGRGAGREPGMDAAGQGAGRAGRAAPVLPVLCGEDAAPHHFDRQLHRQRQAAPAAAEMEHEDRRYVPARTQRRRVRGRRHRFRDVHASACRSRRLEHAARERPLGTDFPEGALRLRQAGIRPLVRGECEGGDPALC
ncbi:hypothetical protein ACVIJW_006656 [Bradyrhizobium barranii subsp. barranii]